MKIKFKQSPSISKLNLGDVNIAKPLLVGGVKFRKDRMKDSEIKPIKKSFGWIENTPKQVEPFSRNVNDYQLRESHKRRRRTIKIKE